MGDRNYQGLINIEDFVKIIGELEDKKLKSIEEGVSKEAIKTDPEISKVVKEWCNEMGGKEQDKIQKAIDFVGNKISRYKALYEKNFAGLSILEDIKQYLQSLK